MQTSPEIIELAKALSKAQAVMEGAIRDSTNPFFKSTYADLASVWDACRKPLADNGLCVIQSIASDQDYCFTGKIAISTKDSTGRTIGTREEERRFIYLNVTSRLLHTSGQWFEDTISVPVEADPQSLGKVTTYIRRYAMMALVGIAPEDDDGEAAAGREPAIGGDIKYDRGQREHWCTIHNKAFFKTDKMRSYAHPIESSKEWCYEKTAKEVEVKQPGPTPGQRDDMEAAVKKADAQSVIPAKADAATTTPQSTQDGQGTAQENKQRESLLKGQMPLANAQQMKAINTLKKNLGEEKFWTAAHELKLQSIAELTNDQASALIGALSKVK